MDNRRPTPDRGILTIFAQTEKVRRNETNLLELGLILPTS